MTATPRIVRPATPRVTRARVIDVPAAPRIRRPVIGVTTRPLGKISLFLAATCILGLTALCYLWQTSEAIAAAHEKQVLAAQLNDVTNTQMDLLSQINALRSYGSVTSSAKRYGMAMPDQSTLTSITVPGHVQKQVVVVHTPPRATTTAVHLAATTSGLSAWWQDLWVALYHVMH